MEKNTGREYVLRVSDEAVINPVYGFICDCGRWTFGDDEFHDPIV